MFILSPIDCGHAGSYNPLQCAVGSLICFKLLMLFLDPKPIINLCDQQTDTRHNP